MATLNLRRFDINKIVKGNIVMLIGKKNTGKSYITKRIVYQQRDIPIACVISATEEENKFFGNMMPPIFIHYEYSSEIITRLLKRQKLVIAKMNKQKEQYGKSDIDPNCLLVLDDCLYDNSWGKDQNMRRIFMNGRHHKITMIFTSQFSLGIGPNLRAQVDFVFILRETYISNRKRLYEHYAGMFPSFDIFCQVMDQCTEDYNCLVIDNTTKSNKLEEQIYWYKADETPEFTLGAAKFWQYSNDNYNPDNTEEDDNIDNMGRKKNYQEIQIKKSY